MMIDEDESLKARLESDHQRFFALTTEQQETYMESARRILPVSFRGEGKAVLFTAIQMMLNDEYLQTLRRAVS